MSLSIFFRQKPSLRRISFVATYSATARSATAFPIPSNRSTDHSTECSYIVSPYYLSQNHNPNPQFPPNQPFSTRKNRNPNSQSPSNQPVFNRINHNPIPQFPSKQPLYNWKNLYPNIQFPGKKNKPRYKPPSSLETGMEPYRSDMPFDFRFSYTEIDPAAKPIKLREPKYSPFGPGRLDRKWTGMAARAVDPEEDSVNEDMEDPKLVEKRKEMWNNVQGYPLTDTEIETIVYQHRHKTRRQLSIGRQGLTHNMLNMIHTYWKEAEAVRIKCMGVPTVNMEHVCNQIEDKTFGKIIYRHRGLLVLYRGRNYNLDEPQVIPLMLWKPKIPLYPKLIQTPIDGLSIEETMEMRRKGAFGPSLTKLERNRYYGDLVAMVRDAFLTKELIRIDCRCLEPRDYKKIGLKLRDLVPCILVSFEGDHIVIWRGANYQPKEDGLLTDKVSFDDSDD